MFGAYVRFKWNFVALRKSSDNQPQHLFLGQRWIIVKTMWMWLSTSSQVRILGLWKKDYQDFGEQPEEYCLEHSVKYESFIQVETHQKKTVTCNFWYRHLQPLGRSQVSTGLSSHVSVPYLDQFYFNVGTMII